MISRQLFLFLCLPLISVQAKAQDTIPQHSPTTASNVISIEGAAFFAPWENFWTLGFTHAILAYERRFYSSKKGNVSLYGKTGVGNISGLWGPQIGMTTLIGKGNSHFDIGTGVMFPVLDPSVRGSFNIWPIAELGYRFQKPEGGLMWKVKVGTTGIGAGVGWAF